MSYMAVGEGEFGGNPRRESGDLVPPALLESPMPEGFEASINDNSIVRWCGPDVAVGADTSLAPDAFDPAFEESQIDLRKALFNDGRKGTAGRIQIPAERITRLLGIMIDLDPGKLNPDNALFWPSPDPRKFLDRIQGTLDRHPLACDAEMRSSGTGLHAILRLDPPVELKTAGEQRHWDAIVRAVQASLPSDLNAPGITALTRPVGSLNSKNRARVEALRPGSPIDPRRIVEFVLQMKEAPFRVVAGILLGGELVAPCPICSGEHSRLSVMDRVGQCYSCGKVSLARLYDTIFLKKEVGDETEEDSAGPERAKPRSGRKAARQSTRR